MSVISLTDYQPRERFDENPWTAADIEGSLDLQDWSLVEHFDFEDPDDDPATPKTRNFTVVVENADVLAVRVVWIDDDDNRDETDPILLSEPTVLASAHDVATRLGYDLSDRQINQVDMLIVAATGVIFNALDQDISWTPPASARQLLSMLCVEVVCRAMSNPLAIGQESETLGAYSHSTTYAREIPGSGLMLTNVEELLVRRAVYGANAGSGRGMSEIDTALDSGLVQYPNAPLAWIK